MRTVIDDIPHLAADPPGPVQAIPFEADDEPMPSDRGDGMSIMSRETRRAMSTDRGDRPPPRPPHPPAPPQRQQRTPINTDRSRSTRHAPTPINSNSSNKSLSNILTPNTTSPITTNTSQGATIGTTTPHQINSPRGDKRTPETDHNTSPKHPRTHNTPASSSTDIPAPQQHVPHEPLLPIQDTDDEDNNSQDISDLETIFEPEDVLYTDFNTKPPPQYHTWQFAPGMAEICETQRHYLENSVTTAEKLTTRVGKSVDEVVEIEVGPLMASLFYGVRELAADEILVFKSSTKTAKPVAQIEKNYDALTTEEVKKHYKLVEAAVRKELKSFVEHKTFKRELRKNCSNICTSRWVLRWKEIDGVRSVKARLTIRGFQDTADVESYASTASRWSQRLVVSLAVMNKWPVWVSDISTAFLRGMPFKELAKLTNTPEREVAFVPPKGWEKYFTELPDMATFDFVTEVLKLCKAVYGLRDAPRAWRIRLDIELKRLGGHALPTDKALYCFYDNNGKLDAVISAHVDDLKGAGNKQRTDAIIKGLESAFGTMKTQQGDFTHCGLKHEAIEGGGYIIHQHAYAQQLICIDTAELDLKDESKLLNSDYVARYMSLLGGLSWLIQTRADICIYVCALQRAASKATVGHLIKLNKLTRWVRRKKCQLTYKPITGPVVLACVSDSAFKTEPNSSVAMRGTVIGLWESKEGVFHPLEYYSRKQRRVCRSTFAAELNGAADAVEVARLINYTLTHTHNPKISPTELMSLEESGKFPVPLFLFTDCRSVFDTLTQSDLRTPSEASLVLIVAMLRELLEKHAIHSISWIATGDMIADGLTKGLISRKALLSVCNQEVWKLKEEFMSHTYGPRNSTADEQPMFSNAVLLMLNFTAQVSE